jgi:hypothetical protein
MTLRNLLRVQDDGNLLPLVNGLDQLADIVIGVRVELDALGNLRDGTADALSLSYAMLPSLPKSYR